MKRKVDERQGELFGSISGAAPPPKLPADLSALISAPLRRPPQKLPIVARDKAHWAKPGAGPEGETCGSCDHFREAYQGSAAGYCNLIAYWHQPKTQARLGRADASCTEWLAADGMGRGRPSPETHLADATSEITQPPPDGERK